jgi:hypothetical protein
MTTQQQTTLEKYRDHVFMRPDRELYTHIGYFISWFSMIELHITFWLAVTTDVKNVNSFELLTKGMDSRIKLERFRQACHLTKREIGPNLDVRLAYFQRVMIRIRNNLSHTWATMPEDSSVIHFSTLSRMPFKEIGFAQKGFRPDTMPLLTLFERGLWLNWFSDDLNRMAQQEPFPQRFEIDNPRSHVPKEFLERHLRQAGRANVDKPSQTPDEGDQKGD